MAYARAVDGIRLHYDVWGRRDGEPLLMIGGLGADMRSWIAQRRAFGARYRCVSFDNRGVGASDKPNGDYDLEQMAADAVAVLDAAGIEQVHVMGASMGGVLSQILAVRYPERVRSLVLACTACRHLPWRRELLDDWAELARQHGMREFVRRNLHWLVGMRSLRRVTPVFSLLAPIAFNVPVDGFVGQIRAILSMDDALRAELCDIAVPTLVIVGSQDTLTPMGDSHELASLIPGAELAVVRGAAHTFMVERAGTFNRTVLHFMDERVHGVVSDGAGDEGPIEELDAATA